jgi:hypothetical protein
VTRDCRRGRGKWNKHFQVEGQDAKIREAGGNGNRAGNGRSSGAESSPSIMHPRR